MKRILALILTAVMLCAMMTSCSSAYKNYDKYITLGDLKKVELSEAKILEKVADAILDLRDAAREEYFVTLEDKEALAEKDDQVVIDYNYKSHNDPDNKDLKLSESTLEGMKAEDFKLVLGSGTFIKEYTVKDDKDDIRNNKGFEDQLIGKKAGETVDVTVTFPDSYNTAELQGVIVVFEVKIKSIGRSTVDISDKELIAEIGYVFTDPDKKEEEEDKDEKASDEENKESTTKFSDLFKDSKFTVDFSEEEYEKFNTVFEISDVLEALNGKRKGEAGKFELELTVPESVKDSEDESEKKFADYAGKKIKVTFTVNTVEKLPAWTDDFVKEQTEEEYETTKAYEEYLYDEYGTTLAVSAIIDSAKFIEVPYKEAKKAYKESLKSGITSTLSSLSGTQSQVDIGSYTQKEFDLLFTDEDYAEANAAAAETALITVKSRLVYEYLFDKFEVTLTKKQYKTELENFYKENQTYYLYYFGLQSAHDVEDYFGKETLETEFKFDILKDKLLGAITVVKDAK